MKKYVLLMLLAGMAAIGCSCGNTEPTRIDAPKMEITDYTLRDSKAETMAAIEPLPVVKVDLVSIADIQPILVEIQTQPQLMETTVSKKIDENIPLDADTQQRIFDLCEKKQIDPYLIFSMIFHESSFEAERIGDKGKAFGLMQIQPRWHKERMANLGVTDLLDPMQNVTVGIDFLNELINMDKGLEWALMYYNGGHKNANAKTNINYANKVIKTAAELAEK